jgi:predicted MPP superfamily phosphohydrolase
LLFAYGLTALSQAVPTLALASTLPWWAALALGGVVLALVLWRLRRLAVDRPRPRWVTRIIDEPLFAHWGASVLGLPLFGLGLVPALALEVRTSVVAAIAYGVALLTSGWAVWGARRRVRVRTIEVPIVGLGPGLDGYRVVQLSDLHIGSFDPKQRGLEWVQRANAVDADLSVVTGDLVTSGTSFYDDVAEVLGELRAKDGVFVSLGNHDQWDDKRLERAIQARGPRVLRNEWRLIERAGASLVLAAVDDRYTGKDDLEATLRDRPQAPTLLLAHYPQFFEPAAERGVDLVLSGHTHGGQLGIPLLADRFNVATLVGQRARGLYRNGRCALYVNAGLGTTGPPMRLGVEPEIAVLVLRSAPTTAAEKES